MLRRILILTIAVLSYQMVSAQYDAKAKALLDKVSAKYKALKSYSANFKYAIHNPNIEGLDDSFEGSAIISGSKYVIKTDASETYTDGKVMWNYIPEINEVNISDYEPEEGEITPTNIYNIYKSGYKYTLTGTEKIGSKSYHVVELSPEDRNNQVFKVRIWIDVNSNAIKRWKMFQKDGNRYTYDISSFKENIPVTDNTFVFDKKKYPGVEAVDLR